MAKHEHKWEKVDSKTLVCILCNVVAHVQKDIWPHC